MLSMAASRVPRVGAPGLRRCLPAIAILLVAARATNVPGAEAPATSSSLPGVLEKSCVRCHGETRKSDLDLRTLAGLLAGGKRGPAVIPGKPEESLLYRFVVPGADPHMPPGERQLSGEDVEALRSWISTLTPAAAEAARGTGPAVSAGGSSPGQASTTAWLPPPGLDPAVVIDLLAARGWREAGISAAPPSGDATFVRRLYLDLLGRPPTRSEREQFLEERSSLKREALIGELLASPELARRLREVFDVVLLGRGKEKGSQGKEREAWREYLERSFRENRPWKDVVREVLLARPQGEGDRGAIWYLYSRKGDAQAMAENAASAFFGVQVGCAKCHNHPVVPEIKQAHYWGLVSFFGRTRNVDTEKGPAVAESAVGSFDRFTNLKGEAFDATLTFFDGAMFEEKRPADGEKELDAPEKYVVPPPAEGARALLASVPRFSRREKLVEAALKDEDRLARVFVNRIWALLLGRGLVHPVDRLDSRHPPSHPELLDWLARDFVASGQDVRHLLGGILRSRLYSVGERPRLDASGNAPPPAAFAYSLDRPLTAESSARTLLVATEVPREEWNPRLEKLLPPLTEMFPEVFPEEPAASLRQALFLTNNATFDALLAPLPGNLTSRLLGLDDSTRRIQEGFLAILGRAPGPEELARTKEYLEARADRAEAGLRQMLWALLASPELYLNH